MALILGQAAWDKLLSEAVLFIPRMATSLVLLVVFWCGGLVLDKLIRRTAQLRRVNEDAISILGSSTKAGLIAVGVVMALGTIGVDVTALVTGLGLTGFALGFALKDIISNALAGVLILIYEPFRREDRIAVTSHEGRVVQITLRYTTLDTGEKEILIPNSNLFTNPIVVFRETAGKEEPRAGPA